MAGEGSLDYDRFELIEGALIPTVPKKHPHSIGLVIVMEWLQGQFRGRRVAPETAVDVGPDDNPTSEPQPDLVVLNRPIDEIDRRPQPRDIVLVVEIADSTLAFDLGAKARLYARAGIPDYWVVDINGRRIVVHREPSLRGYGSVTPFSAEESLAPLAAPEAAVLVKDLLRS